MMKRLLLVICIAAMVIMVSTSAYATVIVDTGVPTSGTVGWVLGYFQWLAAQFTLTQAYTITDILGWMYADQAAEGPGGGIGTISIYGDGGQVPNTANELFSAQFQVPDMAEPDINWYGLSGQNWNLPAGTYWAAFEVDPADGDNYSGYMPYQPPNPIVDEAFTSSGTYFEGDYLDIGVRIYSNTTNNIIPEPASLSLLGLGLAGLLSFRKRKVNT